MSDPAFDLLAAALNRDVRTSLLWVIDENLSPDDMQGVSPAPGLQVITNRKNLSDWLRERGFTVHLSDFDVSGFQAGQFDAVYFRVSKEKAIVHHIINSAADMLRADGELLLAGCKNEGIKTYTDKAAGYLGGGVSRQRGRQTALLARIVRGEATGEVLDDRGYRETVTIREGDVEFATKPGIYGWNKIDQGSRLLVDCLRDYLPTLPQLPERVIDLGCGYGYLAVMAHRLLATESPWLVATDNNVAATALCQDNFIRHGVQGEVVLADCGAGIGQVFDLVLCNPPFHQGFATESDLTERFVQAAGALLCDGGRALFVVNSFIPLEKKARPMVKHIDTLVNNGRFKVLALAP